MQTRRHRDVANHFSNFPSNGPITVRCTQFRFVSFMYAERSIEFSDSRRSFVIIITRTIIYAIFRATQFPVNAQQKSITVNCQTMSIENGHLNS